jgi:hypothetical protein
MDLVLTYVLPYGFFERNEDLGRELRFTMAVPFRGCAPCG